MTLPLPIPPLRLFEIDDQSWFSTSLRSHVQAVLTHLWRLRFTPLQPASPASLVARTLQSVLGRRLHDYTFVDFCSGAGGPVPYIEQEINGRAVRLTNGAGEEGEEGGGGEGGVDFVMTDLHPHIRAWEAAVKQRENLHFVPGAVDAADLSTHRLGHVLLRARDRQHHHHPKKEKKKNNNNNTGEKVFRLFHLAFHHFPDPLARRILQNTIAASDGFAIFELQGRDLGSLFTICAMGPFLMLGSWYWFWGNWELLFWTYVVPVVPFVVVFDGVVSALRTRREGEVMALVREAVEGESGGVEGWRFETGSEVHTWPVGRMNYFIGVKEGGR